jgi:hypothetical protein
MMIGTRRLGRCRGGIKVEVGLGRIVGRVVALGSGIDMTGLIIGSFCDCISSR